MCLCVCPRKNFLLQHKSESSLFLSTGTQPALVRTPRESCSAQPGQSSDRPNLPPHKKKVWIFSFLSPVFGQCPPKHSLDRGSKGSAFNVQTSKVEGTRSLPRTVPSQCRRCIGVTSVKSGLAMKSGCVKSREPPSLRLCSRRQEEPASSRPPSSSGWPHYLPSGWMNRTAWWWPGCGHGYLSASCAPPSPASEARGGSLTSTRKSCILPLPSSKLGCPPEQSYHSYVTCLFLAFS